MRRRYLAVGLVGAVLSFAVAVVSFIVGGLAVGLGWLSMTLLGILLILAYFRVRLYVADESITETGLIGETTIRFEKANQVTWKTRQRGGRVVIKSTDARITLCFNQYDESERNEVIDVCRNRFSAEVQEGWPQFVKCVLEPEGIPRTESKLELLLTALLVIASAVFLASISFYYWHIGGGGLLLLFGGMASSLLVLWVVWGVPVRFRQLDRWLPKIN